MRVKANEPSPELEKNNGPMQAENGDRETESPWYESCSSGLCPATTLAVCREIGKKASHSRTEDRLAD